MASRLRTPTLSLAGLCMCLALAIIGTGGRSLHVYYHQRPNDPWLLPLWPGHIDSRELQMLIGTSSAILILNAIIAIALLVSKLPANAIILVSSFLSTIIAAISIGFTTMINSHAPHRDTLQTWTCRWSATEILTGRDPPHQFQGLCDKTRFAYYTTIPLLIIQILLLALGICALFARPKQERHQQIEKQQGMQLQDVSGNEVHNVSYETKTERGRIYQDGNGYYGVAK